MSTPAWWQRGAVYGSNPREREHDASVGATQPFARRLNTHGPFRKNDSQRLVDGAFSEAPRRDQAGEAEDMIGVTVRDGEKRRRKHVGAKCDLQAFARIHEQLQRPVPQPVRIHAAAETAQRLLHLTLLSVVSLGRPICQLPDPERIVRIRFFYVSQVRT